MQVADVWVLDVHRLTAAGCLGGYLTLLAPEERQRLDEFRSDADRTAYLAAHGLARTALSWRAPSTAPAAWRFRATRYGRPEVAAPQQPTRLTFNLSHTRRVVACVVTETLPCGIDVEHTDGAADVALLARGVLTTWEREALDAVADDRRRTEFFRYWTLKEAYVKARGLGMSLPLDSFGFDLDADAIAVRHGGQPLDDPARWQFTQWLPDHDTVAATALRTDTADGCRVVVHRDPPPLDA